MKNDFDILLGVVVMTGIAAFSVLALILSLIARN